MAIKKYTSIQETPLKWHQFARFGLFPLKVLYVIISLLYLIDDWETVYRWMRVLGGITIVLQLIFFVGSFKWRKYSYKAKMASLIHAFLMAVYNALLIGSDFLIFSLAVIVIACLEFVYYLKREPLYEIEDVLNKPTLIEKLKDGSVSILGGELAKKIENDFNNLIGLGKSITEIEEYIMSYKPYDWDESASEFYSALALLEWEYGVLTKEIQEKTIKIIAYNNDSSLYKLQDQQKRKEILYDLVNMLYIENENPKTPVKPYVPKSPFKQGDVFALLIRGHYVYFHVSGVVTHKHEIEELQSEEMHVMVFTKTSEKLLDTDAVNTFDRFQMKYKFLSEDDEKILIKPLWFASEKELKNFTDSAILIGNIDTEFNVTVNNYADFQFNVLEKTISRLFAFETKKPNNQYIKQ